ncbi:MAG TPA: ABATE domain-containing protein [Anaerolineaceae bacterium]|nr:ABATE domain-containing protein [Anaerolineaceae bacterium]
MESQAQLSPGTPRFDFDSGNLALDFANTAEWHASHEPVEHLPAYADLVAWGAEAGLLAGEQAAGLLAAARRQSAAAGAWLGRAIELREVLYRIFAAAAGEQPAPPEDVDALTAFWRELAQRTRLEVSPGGLGFRLEELPADPLAMLWPVVRAAVDLLASPQLARIGQCADDRGCGWLFIDTTRNRSRRWCSMESCGNRAKAQRHYGRVRAQGA